jgi:hypothetical protein
MKVVVTLANNGNDSGPREGHKRHILFTETVPHLASPHTNIHTFVYSYLIPRAALVANGIVLAQQG